MNQRDTPGKPEPPLSEQPQSGWWRTVSEAINSNAKTVRLISIILAATKTIELVRTTR